MSVDLLAERGMEAWGNDSSRLRRWQCPNGGFPIDFWHGDRPGGIRFHAADEGFLPSVEELREHLAAIGDGKPRR